MGIRADIQSLSPSALIELFELDLRSLDGGGLFRFHAGTNEVSGSIVWQGNTYVPFPIKADGFEVRSSGALPRPTVTVANKDGLISALVSDFQNLIGCPITRIRTVARYLDAVNFTSGVNASADPNQEFPRETWVIDVKRSETAELVSFELTAPFDVMGQQLPARQIIRNTCSWAYRSAECGYTGGPVATDRDIATASMANDRCGKRLTSCKLRFGATNQLPFGGFPAAGLMR